MSLPDFSPASFAKVFSPDQAARIIWESLLFWDAEKDLEYRRRYDRLLRENPVHQWFCYCLDAVARRAKVHDE